MKNTGIREIIYADLKRYGLTKTSSRREIHQMSGYLYTRALRYAKYYKAKHNLLLFAYWRNKLYRLGQKYGYQISYATDIGKGFYIGHRGTVIINWTAHLGENVNVAAGVTIGLANRGKRKGVPTIGNRVWIGTNAVVVGKITIGDDVLIAPGAYVNFDVPSHSIVIGNPGVIHARENATEGYIENTV